MSSLSKRTKHGGSGAGHTAAQFRHVGQLYKRPGASDGALPRAWILCLIFIAILTLTAAMPGDGEANPAPVVPPTPRTSARFSQPQQFSFKPEDWPRWSQRFARYRSAARLDLEDGDRQVNALLFAMGDESEAIFESFALSEAQSKDYAGVLKKFEDYYTPKRNRTFERRKFYDSVQGAKSIEEFERELHQRAKYCAFVDKNEQLCDQFIRGLADKELQERLCLLDDVTLDKVVTAAKQAEHVKRDLGSSASAQSADEVRSKSKFKQPNTFKKGKSQYKPNSYRDSRNQGGATAQSGGAKSSTAQSAQEPCSRCGYDHPNRRCPASGKTCKNCRGRGHFAKMCFKRKVHEVTQDEDHSERHFELDSVEVSQAEYSVSDVTVDSVIIDDNCSPWMEDLMFCGSDVTFKIDTGADITVISDKTYSALKDKPPLQASSAMLQSPGGRLTVKGSFTGDIYRKDMHFRCQVIVVADDLKCNLLSRGVSQKIGVVRRTDAIGLLKVKPVTIELRDGAEPFAVHTARHIGYHLLPKVQEELQRLQKEGIIKPIEVPTDWCAPMVPILKKSGKIRICTDFKRLNQNVKRPYINLPNLDDIAPSLVGATHFSTMDMNSGFHQVPLDERSMPLTTFITPFGRFCYQRLPMGINIGPEVFQLQMQKLLRDLPGCAVIMDDILVWGRSPDEHDRRLKAVQQRITDSGLTLNQEKCQLGKREVTFFGHILSADGLRPSPDKIKAILDMPPPTNLTELRSLCGMLNYLSKFTDGLATVIKPMTDLMRADTSFLWGQPQQSAFLAAKTKIKNLPSLQYFSTHREVVVSADASSYGLGAALLQREGGNLVPIAFASRSMSDAERRYSQIERECLASAWACEKFRKYLVGLPEFELWTDHKPLVPLIGRKTLDQAPIRCQRLLLRLMQFNPIVSHKPGKQLVIADALSRNPTKDSQVCQLSVEVNTHVDAVMSQLPVSDNRMSKIRQAVIHDNELGEIMNYVVNGWPTVSAIVPHLKVYHEAKDMLSVVNGLLVYQNRIVIPRSQRQEILGRLHESHQGFHKCMDNAERCVWWPGIRGELKKLCEQCELCISRRPAHRSEPLRPTTLPSRPWEKIGADLCFHNQKNYLILTDYYSRWLEVKHLTSITSRDVINKCRQVFATHGVPDEFHCDNGTQFVSQEFKSFADRYGFAVTTSSPYFAQANGAAESAVKVAKNILSANEPDLALLNYRAEGPNSTNICIQFETYHDINEARLSCENG